MPDPVLKTPEQIVRWRERFNIVLSDNLQSKNLSAKELRKQAADLEQLAAEVAKLLNELQRLPKFDTYKETFHSLANAWRDGNELLESHQKNEKDGSHENRV